jgi:hypothetical protein
MTSRGEGADDGDTVFRVRPPEDWRRLIRTRANVLALGPPRATEAFSRALTPLVRAPIHAVKCEAGFDTFPPTGTLILRAVDALDADQQDALLRWLEADQPELVQIISLSSTSLYDRVRDGSFSEQLYYWLNVISLEIVEAAAAPNR